MKTIGMIIQVNDEVVHIERGATEQGYVYKNYDNFESGKGICYIPELSDTTYDRKYFDDNFGDLAVEVFETIDWQSPYSYYDEITEYMEENKMKTIKKVLMEEISDDNLAALLIECNGWNGSFEHLERFDTKYDLDMFLRGNDAHWFACRIHYGGFDPNDEYFNFDSYGNLQSFNEYEYNEMINDEKEEIVETALELHEQGNIDIQWLIDEYVQA